MSRSLPTVSIVVPSHNRHSNLAELVEGCQKLTYPADLLELVIVDDGSEPPVAFARHSHLPVRVLRQKQSGPASARNAGIQAATGEVVALIDDDCSPRPDWLSRMVSRYCEDPAALIGGATVNALIQNPYASASQALIDFLYQHDAATASRNTFFTSSNLAGARARFLAMGGFCENFPLPAGEDRDLCERWRMTGPLISEPAAIVDHSHHMALRGFVKQHYRYGRGARVLDTRRSERGEENLKVKQLSFYRGLLSHPFRENNLPRAATISTLFLVAQLSTALGYLSARSR